MKKFTAEFKKFIMRGNIVDMAVGVIVGSSFTAIVSALSDHVLKPIINWLLALLFDKNSLTELYTFLGDPVRNPETQEIILEESIYIDWGAFINSIINFLLVAIVLFLIIKFVNALREKQKQIVTEIREDVPTRADIKIMKKQGIKITDEKAVREYMEKKKQALAEEAERKKAEEEEKARLERLENPTTEDLLKDILAVMKGEPDSKAKAEMEAKAKMEADSESDAE